MENPKGNSMSGENLNTPSWEDLSVNETLLLSASSMARLAAQVHDSLVKRIEGFDSLDPSIQAEEIVKARPGLTFEDALLEVLQREGWGDEQ